MPAPRLSVAVSIAGEKVLLHNNGAGIALCWGVGIGGTPAWRDLDHAAHFVYAGTVYELSTTLLKKWMAREGAPGEERVPFEVYLSDRSHQHSTARVTLVVRRLADARLSILAGELVLAPGGW